MRELRNAKLWTSILMAGMFFSITAFFTGVQALAQEEATVIEINFDLDQEGVGAENMIERSLFHACRIRPLHLGFRGVGTFEDSARIEIPFIVPRGGRYRAVISYGLPKEPDIKRREHHGPHIRGNAREWRNVSISVNERSPESWRDRELWPTTPHYPWGSRHLYIRGAGIKQWTFSDETIPLAAGRQTLTLEVSGGPILFDKIILTTGETPENPEHPHLLDHYVNFPALEFTGRETEEIDGRMRIKFRGVFTNLAPMPVSYEVTTSPIPRINDDDLFEIVSVAPEDRLDLEIGEEKEFELTVESNAPAPYQYSQLIRLDLRSRDVEGLAPKPYLMAANNGYIEVNPEGRFIYTKGYHDGQNSVQDGTDMRYIIPVREHLGPQDGRYQRNVTEAFVYALADAPPDQPILTRGRFPDDHTRIFDLAEHARERKDPPTFDTWDRTFAAVIAGAGQGMDADSLKDMMMLLAREYPYYPVSRWDAVRPSAMPQIQWSGEDVYPMASYVKLLQEQAVSDDEHFLFLHNVVLPYMAKNMDQWRIYGTLAEDAQAGDTTLIIERDKPANIFPTDLTGAWLRIGEGDRAEYVRKSGSVGTDRLNINPDTPGPLKFDHPAGTPWTSYHMWEDVGLEGSDIWQMMSISVSSADAAIIEQCAEKLGAIFATQNLYREDGSFAEEPGSYGFGAFHYVEMVENIEHFLGKENARIPEDVRERMFNALVMWNKFPFSDGMIQMLNHRGTNNQIPRQSRPFDLLRRMFPDREETIEYYAKVIEQEKNRAPGTYVDNYSFKVEGWGYAMLRGPGSWDRRMETLVASAKGIYDPPHHMSRDCMSIGIFAHGAMMTPRYGYHWINPPQLIMYNQVAIPDTTINYWGYFLHFDDNETMPSAVAATDMAGPWSHEPGFARQERWAIQLPEYLFDFYSVEPREEGEYSFSWGYRNLGELEIVTPEDVELERIFEEDGEPWDPFNGIYRQNTGKEGMGFHTSDMWQVDWTMNEGNVTFGEDYPNPPRGARVRLTMAAEEDTRIVTAYLRGPARQARFQIRQDFVEVKRAAPKALFVAAYDPIGVDEEATVISVELLGETADDGARVVRVQTADGVDWFLAGTKDFDAEREARRIGPFTTDAAMAVVRVRNGQVVYAKIAAGAILEFDHEGVAARFEADERGQHHFAE